MFEALVITLREGVEATLVLAIAVSVLRRSGAAHLIGALYFGALVALAASVGVGALASHLTYNEELAEGIAKLVGAALVLSLTVWMWRSGPNMKREVESGLERATGGSGAFGVGLFAFGMVFREGVETAIFLSAAGFNSQGVGLWIGALAGLALAIVFGALFIRGTLRVPLKPFFSLTSAVLLLIAVQLLIGGLHELSEAQVLPSSRTEMALIGPIVKNELLLFTLTVALAAGWLLFGPSTRPPKAAVAADGPEARLARAERASEQMRRRWTGVVALLVVGFLATAFVQNSRLPDRPPAQPLEISGDSLAFDAATLADGHAHFFSVLLPDSSSGTAQSLRFFAIRSGEEVRTCFDACQICGDKGYFEDGGALVCRNCTSPIAIATLGRAGGCNPIPLPSLLEGGRVTIGTAALMEVRPYLKGR
jgi:FTR1 family protein